MADFLQALKAANLERTKHRCDGQDGMDPLYAAVELGGEVGEILNDVKKLVREQRGWKGSRTTVARLASEIGDVMICLNILAEVYGIDIQAATIAKFNDSSRKYGFPIFLGVEP